MVDDLLIRPAEPADIDRLIDINITVWGTTYRGIVADAILDAMTPDSLRGKWERILQNTQTLNTLCFVAVVAGQVVGYVVCGKNREEEFQFDWQLYAIYLFKEHQGQGVGKQLFQHAVDAMRVKQVRSFILFVLEDNHPTRKFYESLGPDYKTQKVVNISGMDYVEIGYGWSEI